MNSHPLPTAPPPTQNAPASEGTGHCTACGIYHGSVGAELNCLRAAVRVLRIANHALRAALQDAQAK
jgi:hypothetical protein